MNWDEGKAYSRRQWFWAVNLIAVLGAVGYLFVPALNDANQSLALLPFVTIISLIISWVFIATPLSFAMRRPASFARAASWGGGVAATIAFFMFSIAQIWRWRAQIDDSISYQLGGGDFVRELDGVVTPYGWWVILQLNLFFIALGICIALIVRATIGPGKTTP